MLVYQRVSDYPKLVLDFNRLGLSENRETLDSMLSRHSKKRMAWYPHIGRHTHLTPNFWVYQRIPPILWDTFGGIWRYLPSTYPKYSQITFHHQASRIRDTRGHGSGRSGVMRNINRAHIVT
jgi:hypothetical protein